MSSGPSTTNPRGRTQRTEALISSEYDHVYVGTDPDSDFSIVAVHGLDGDAYESWTAGSKLWLRDFLPQKLSCRPRIMTFGYNANLKYRTAQGRLSHYADNLLGDLIAERSESWVSIHPRLTKNLTT